MSDQTETRPDPQERVKVRFEGDETTEREVRRCTLKHMADGWQVVGEESAKSDSGDDASSGDDAKDKSKGRGAGQKQES